MQSFRTHILLISVVGLGLMIVTGCVRELSPVTGKRQAYAFSWDQEQQIGKKSDAEIVQQFGLYEDPAVQQYVQEVGRGVLTKSDLRDKEAPEEYRSTAFTFRVLDSPVVNAFALPGGYVYVTRGLLSHLQNEAQLAVVLGHEVAHVAARHSARQALRAQTSQIGLLAAAILGSQVLGDPGAMQQVMGLGSQALQLLLTRYSRDAEREADQLGVRYAALRGYEAGQAADFFESLSRISEKEGVRLPSWESTHPDPGERQATVRELGEQYAQKTDLRVIGQDDFMSKVEGMVIGEDPREGFVEGGRFYHPELAFQFPVPDGWQVRNEKSAVLLIDSNRQAVMALELAPVRSAREGAEKLSQVQGVKMVQSAPIRVNGMSAYAVQAVASTKQGEAALVNYFIEREGRVYSFLGYTGAQTLGAYAKLFQNTIEGFSSVTDPRILGIQPARISIIEVQRSGPFRTFLPDNFPPWLSAADLAILNQVQLDETIPAGAKLKLPRPSQTPAPRSR